MRTFARISKDVTPTVDLLKAALKIDLAYEDCRFIDRLVITDFVKVVELCDETQDHYDFTVSGSAVDVERLVYLLRISFGESYENVAD